MQKIWSTADVPPRDRLAYWVDAVCDGLVHLDCVARGDRPSFSEILPSGVQRVGPGLRRQGRFATAHVDESRTTHHKLPVRESWLGGEAELRPRSNEQFASIVRISALTVAGGL